MVRRFKIEDLNAVMAIWLNTNITAHDFIPSDYWKDNFEIVKDILPTAEIYVYEDQEIKGFIGIMEGYIAGLFVSEACQSKGIGKQLIECAKVHYDTLNLNVYEKNNNALTFYKQQGFNRVEKTVDENTNEVEISMVWHK